MTYIIEARNMQKSFGGKKILQGIDLAMSEGEVLSVIGPSGSGKSTFLRCISTLEAIDGGDIFFKGQCLGYTSSGETRIPLTEHELVLQRSEIGMVFQSFNLFPHRTVLQNVMEGPVVVKKMRKADARGLAMDLLGKVGMAGFAEHYPDQLSGGQKQRVAIARALAMEPSLLLFDEPTSALDPGRTREILNLILSLATEGRSMIVVTHQIDFARQLGGQVAFMKDGRVECQVPAAALHLDTPHDALRSFLGSDMAAG